jgi:hypothetical protein
MVVRPRAMTIPDAEALTALAVSAGFPTAGSGPP